MAKNVYKKEVFPGEYDKGAARSSEDSGDTTIFPKIQHQKEDYAGQDNLSQGWKNAFPITKQVFRKFSVNKEQHHESSLSYIFTHKQHELISTIKAYRQIDEKELEKRIQRQVHEETRVLEKKFSAQAFSPAEMTDRVYDHLTKRLMVEKERLGY